MVRLAGLIWREFGTDVCLVATSDLGELNSQIMQSGPSADVIVRFGHVLVQTSDQKDAIDSFADILSAIRLNSNLILAVDAQNESAVRAFHCSVDGLIGVLVTSGLELRAKDDQRRGKLRRGSN